MRRKVIQLAGKTFVISLPTSWVKQYNIKKGEEVDVTEKGPMLEIISPKNQKPKEIFSIDTGKINYYENYIDYLYQSGIDEVEIKLQNPEMVKGIQHAIDSLLGFEIVDKGQSYCIIRNVSIPSKEEFNPILRRTYLHLKEMSLLTISQLEKRNEEDLGIIVQMEKTNNKFTDFLKRILNKEGTEDPVMTTYLYCVARDLERVADEYRFVAKLLLSSQKQPSKEIINGYLRLHDYLSFTYELFYDFKKDKIDRFYKTQKEVQAVISELFKLKDFDVRLAHHAFSIERQLTEMMGPIFLLNMR